MLEQAIDIIKAAGKLVKARRDANDVKHSFKKDGSDITNVDLEAEKLLTSMIYEKYGKDQLIISEEEIAEGKDITINGNQSFWLLDPIDGTKSYANNRNDYCINMAYMVNNMPNLALIYAPEEDTVWYAIKGKGAFKKVGNNDAKQIFARTIPSSAVAVTSFAGHQMTDEIRAQYNIKDEIVIASAVKFCYIAEGLADYYFRKRHQACDWDIAPGHLIVEESGGVVEMNKEQNFIYGTKPYLAPDLIAMGKKS